MNLQFPVVPPYITSIELVQILLNELIQLITSIELVLPIEEVPSRAQSINECMCLFNCMKECVYEY